MKQCRQCKLNLSLENFSKYRSKCKACRVVESNERLITRITNNPNYSKSNIEVLICKQCKKTKTTSEFHKNKLAKSGYHTKCAMCLNNNASIKKYGISKDFLESMAFLHGNKCTICKTPESNIKWVIDHCHATGKIRGLLCNECNLGLGLFKDNITALKNAAEYLAFHNEMHTRPGCLR